MGDYQALNCEMMGMVIDLLRMCDLRVATREVILRAMGDSNSSREPEVHNSEGVVKRGLQL